MHLPCLCSMNYCTKDDQIVDAEFISKIEKKILNSRGLGCFGSFNEIMNIIQYYQKLRDNHVFSVSFQLSENPASNQSTRIYG